jgi:O-antigen/teichoic acid export membrane protein
VSVVNKIAVLGFALVALALGTGLPGVLVAQALAGFMALAMAMRLYRRVTSGPLRYSSGMDREILVGGSALFSAAVLSNIQPYIDAVVLSKLATADAIGWYGAAKNIMGTMLAPALIVGAASFPRLSRTVADGGPFKAEVRAALRPMLWLGTLAAVGTYLFADDAIAIVYGQRHFAPSGIILKVYAPGFFLLFVNVLFGYALFALERAKAFSALKLASVAIGTALELVLIPFFQQQSGNGGIGVVAAFVASEFLVSGGAFILLRQRKAAPAIALDMARAIGSAALTLLFFWALPPLPFLIGVPLCIIVFLLCTAGLGLVRRSDAGLLRALIRKEA